MKEKIDEVFEFILGMVIITVVFFVIPGIAGYIENHYWRDAQVVEIENENVVMEDRIGHIWVFEGDGFEVGDNVKMYMFNNYTDSIITDDEIIKIKIK